MRISVPALSLRRQRWLADLLDLGATAVELLPVHESVREAFLVQRGLTSYWGYNTIGYFAPHQQYSAALRPTSAEGPTGDPDVLALRAHQSRPILTTLLLSFGIPRRAANPHLALFG
jgi:pullulanase/glycogen debranching enzyme